MFSKTAKEHISRFLTFPRGQFQNKPLKVFIYSFFQPKVRFLGHDVSQSCLKVDSDKIEAVLEFPKPKNETQTRSFLGLAFHYRRFVQGFASIAGPSHKTSDTLFVFQLTDEAQFAFDS